MKQILKCHYKEETSISKIMAVHFPKKNFSTFSETFHRRLLKSFNIQSRYKIAKHVSRRRCKQKILICKITVVQFFSLCPFDGRFSVQRTQRNFHLVHKRSFLLFCSSVKTDMGTSGAISRLYIANANKKDSGNYSCALADVAAATTVSVHVLNGIVAPSITNVQSFLFNPSRLLILIGIGLIF